MADRDFNRRPRWNSTGYWTDQHEEDENRPGDRSRARDYGREEMRRYGRQSQEQGERLRSLRGQGENWDSGLNTGTGDWEDRDRDYDMDRGRYAEGRGDDYRRYSEHGNRFSDEERDRIFRRERGGDWDWQANREGWDYGGRYEHDRDYQTRQGGYDQGGRGYDRDRSFDRDRWFDRDRPQDDRGENRVDNYWGLRQQRQDGERQYGSRGQNEWWDNTGGRPDYTSARRAWPGSGGAPRDDAWMDEGSYDMDIGYGYEFGTDYDFLYDTNLEEFGQPRRDGGHRGRVEGHRGRVEGHRGRVEGHRGRVEGQRGRVEGQRGRAFWEIPGPYTGIGPSGYQRSDERIMEDLCQIFTYNGQIDASGLAVQVENGEVTLEGDVDRRDEKYLAEDIAASIPGVVDVSNRIRVQADDGVRVRGMGMQGMGNEDVVMLGRIQPGMRVAGLDGKHIGQVKEVREDGFMLDRAEGGSTLVPFRAIKRTNGQIILHVASNQIDQQGWKS